MSISCTHSTLQNLSAYTMECFHDFCLACDRESFSGPYCSQACRLADLEKASPPPSPSYRSASTQPSTASSGLSTGSGYVLAPPYKFPSRTGNSSRPSSEAGRSQAASQDGSRTQQKLQRSLTPSSSRSSLSSNMSISTGTVISEQARQAAEPDQACQATHSRWYRQPKSLI